MAEKREVVVTGTGVVSPIGIGKQAFWQGLMEGTSGVGPLPGLQDRELAVGFGAALKEFQAKEFVAPRKSLKVMCREVQTGFAAARLAVHDGQITQSALDPDRLGIVFGADMFYCDLSDMADAFRAARVDEEVGLEQWGRVGMTKLYPLWLLLYLPNMVACHLAITHDARGPNNTVCAGDVSSLLALIEAKRYIERGHADVMICGGTGTRLSPGQLVYRDPRTLSRRIDDPEGASRPFDAFRDGMVNGEGAAAFVLETREHAEARGAVIQARILGCGCAFDAAYRGAENTVPSPDGVGIRRAMEQALRESHITAQAISHVNAHGASTIPDDCREASAIRAVLGDVPVTAPKSFFGNLGAGSGAVEMVASVIALQKGVVPFTRNVDVVDPACDIRVVRGEPLETPQSAAMILNQSTLGQCTAVVLAQP